MKKFLMIVALLQLVACAAPWNRSIASEDIEPTPLAGAQESLGTPVKSETDHDKTKVVVEKAKAVVEKHVESAPAPELAIHNNVAKAPVVSGVSPAVSLKWLKNGNIRFTHNLFREDGDSELDRKRLVSGQHPHAIILSCSDSRVPPEVIFDQKLGEVFVVRTAGEALDFGALASIEYAVEHLGTQLILVLGHEQCGAVKAAAETKDGSSAGSKNLDQLVKNIRPRIEKAMRMPASDAPLAESIANAKGAAEELMNKSDIVQKHVLDGTLSVQSAVYHLESGEVIFNESK